MKNSNDTIGNRTRDLPSCSAVPQPTAPPSKQLSVRGMSLLHWCATLSIQTVNPTCTRGEDKRDRSNPRYVQVTKTTEGVFTNTTRFGMSVPSSWSSYTKFKTSQNTGRFIMFSVITNICNKKTKGPTLMELFTAPGKLKKFFLTTRDVRCVHHG